jgi:transcription-repair coupling factor (superfamily II helicase)
MPGPSLDDLLAAASASTAVVYGLTHSFAAYAAAELGARLAGSRLVVVTPDDATAQKLCGDIAFFAPRPPGDDPAAPPPALRVPALDTSPYADLRPERQALMGRMAALFRLARGGTLVSPIAVVPAPSLIRRVMPPAELDQLSAELVVNADIDRDATAELLARAGFARTPVVEDPGTFAIRGGVIDVFSPLYHYPVRVELFGDTIEAMRLFDPQSQRTLRQIEKIFIHPVRETVATSRADMRAKIFAAADAAHHPSKATRRVLEQIESGEEFMGIDALTPAFHHQMVPLWHYLGHAPAAGGAQDPPRWLILDPDAVLRAVDDELDIAHARYQTRIDEGKLAFAPGEHYVSRDELDAILAALPHRMEARTLEVLGEAATLDVPDHDARALRFAVDDNRALRAELERMRRQSADELLKPLAHAIQNWRKDEWRVAVAAGSATRAQQLASLLADYHVPARIHDMAADAPLAGLEPGAPLVICTGNLSTGFALRADRLALLSADDIFGPRRRSTARQRAAAKRARAALMGGMADFSQLAPGDHVVHELHGVGRYQGLAKLPATRGGPEIDFLLLEYTGGQLYLPVYRLGEVHRYVGAEGLTPRLDRLGGQTWQTTRSKVSQKIRALAEELLQIYAQRAVLPGHGFPPADAMFREFEATFGFEETPDQQRAIDEVVADMEGEKPMDRLVCGDVGYGKTEVALRAMFKAVLGGKQAAFLAPTTVLVEQHYQTMRERFTGWPVQVAKLSRFQSRADQVAVIKGLAAGSVDLVVGTHRLLSRDVRFKDLGLLVIDEEQRFGVAHKERLKRMRTQIDVLTLTATPIPRTLHLAMSGMRDLSIIATPPADRRSIRTFVAGEDDSVLVEAIRRELGRGGQIFFVCPRIEAKMASTGGRFARGAMRSLGEWADHLAELVPEARVAEAHGQMGAEALEKIMITFVAGELDILVCTTIVESGLDIARANTMFIYRADTFGLSQLYQLRGRIGRSKERAFCYLLVPPLEKLSTEARRRLETLQRFTDLGAGFEIASQDLEIRGGGELLGAKQSGSIAAVGFETYIRMLEDAVAELRGQETPSLRRARDPELNVDMPGYIPDDYVPDTGQRLDLYKRLADAEDEDEIRQILGEIEDRYGNVPREVFDLGDLMMLKLHARTLRAQSLELTPARMSLALAEDTPLVPEKLLELVRDRRYRLTPDMRLVRSFTADEARHPVHSARQCLLDLVAYVT